MQNLLKRLGNGLLLAHALVGSSARADSPMEAQELCQKAGRNAPVFELLLAESTARSGTEPGSALCTWSFARPASASPELLVELKTELMPSQADARRAILISRLPENHRGKTIEALPKLGDGGNYRATVDDGATRALEIEATKDRRHFLLSVKPGTASPLTYRVLGQSINFLGVGIRDL